MLTILFLLIWRSVATIHGDVKACAPCNVAIAHLRTDRGLRWAIPVALVAVPAYLYAAYLTTIVIDRGGSKWLLVVTLICFVDACKFASLALLSPVLRLKVSPARRGL